MLPLTRTVVSSVLKSPSGEFCKIKLRTTSGTLTLRYRKQPMLQECFRVAENGREEGNMLSSPSTVVNGEIWTCLDIDDKAFEKLTDLSECKGYDCTADGYGSLNDALEPDYSAYHFWASEDSCASDGNSTVTVSTDEFAYIPYCSNLLEGALHESVCEGLNAYQSSVFCNEDNVESICSFVDEQRINANPTNTSGEVGTMEEELLLLSNIQMETELNEFPNQYVKLSHEEQEKIDNSELELIHFPVELQLESSSRILPFPCSEPTEQDSETISNSFLSGGSRSGDHFFHISSLRSKELKGDQITELHAGTEVTESHVEGLVFNEIPERLLVSFNKRKRKSRVRRNSAWQAYSRLLQLPEFLSVETKYEKNGGCEFVNLEDGDLSSLSSEKLEDRINKFLMKENGELHFVFDAEAKPWNGSSIVQVCHDEKEVAHPVKRSRQPRKPAKRLAQIYARGQPEDMRRMEIAVRASRPIAISASELVRNLRQKKCRRKAAFDDVGKCYLVGRRGSLPEEAVAVLRQWLDSHLDYPFATKQEKDDLVSITGLGLSQVENWLSNARYKLRTRTCQCSDPSSLKLELPVYKPKKRPKKSFCYVHAP